MSTPKKLYAVMVPAGWGIDFRCTLMEDTGEVLHEHISSSKGWGRRDLIGGLGRKHNVATKFPDGYELVEVDRWSDVPDEVLSAYRALVAERDGRAES